jgi:diguanylate cyclase (GGDEF)-like protein/PAS domain S-box-containing protein
VNKGFLIEGTRMDPTDAAQQTGLESSQHGGRILVVDDTPSNLRLLINMLKQHAYVVHPATSGQAALRFLETTLPDLILLDVMMPGMDGYQVCERLKADPRTREIPVVFISAADQPLNKVKAFGAGGVDYIVKPFEAEEVLARIETHMALHKLQQDLEQRVAERTAALVQANAQLNAEITQRQRAEERLREREARIRRLVESDIIGVYFWAGDGRIAEANDAFLQLLGYTRDQLLAGDLRWVALTPPEYLEADERAMADLRSNGSFTPYEKELLRKDAVRVPVLVGGARFEDSADEGVGFVLDLTERKRAEEFIKHMAHHDTLTALPNRALLQDRMHRAIAQAHRNGNLVATVFIDLDHFKNINDSLGHGIGDRLLVAAANRLQRCLREGDTVARLGGDEFVILLPSLEHGDDAALVAQKALYALNQPFEVDSHELQIGGSIGISLYPTDGNDVESLMRAADTAMYHAKERGRGNLQFYTEALNEAAQQRLNTANRLRRALNESEFVMNYQPEVDINSGRIFAAEALLRWRKPGGDLISFGQFIDSAEETGLIQPIGEWALRQACDQLRIWHDAGHTELHIAVNLSPRQFLQPHFEEVVSDCLKHANLAPSALELEITESVLMQPSDENAVTLAALVTMGVQLSVDDFGTGYSNLAYLQRFPVHSLKIDRSFVSGLEHEPDQTAIVTAILALARSLHLNVVAEGVETSGQARFLKAHGCQSGQGFFYCPPVSPERFSQLLAS